MSLATSALAVVANLSKDKKMVIDGLSIGTVVGTLVSYLPSAAALVSVIWGLIRIYETVTVQKIVKRLTKKRKGAQ